MTRTKKQVLSLGPQAISDLFKPGRLEIYESLQVSGPASIAELAARLGRAPDSLYYHIKKLLAIGVVVAQDKELAREAGPGRKGATYAVSELRLDVKLDPSSRRSREAWSSGAAAVLRLAQRDFDAALKSRDVCTRGPRRNLYLQRGKLRVNAAQLKEINLHLEAIQDLIGQHSGNTTGKLHAVTCVLTALEERKERKER